MSNTLHPMVLAAYRNQDTLNKKLREDWVTQGWPYYRAVWTEAGEAVQHIKSWFWWKEGQFNKPPNGEVMSHVRMELVDILHFGLSIHFIDIHYGHHVCGSTRPDPFNRLAELAVEHFSKPLTHYSAGDADYMIQTLEVIVEYAIGTRTFDWRPFSRACLAAGMDLEMTLALYFAKTTLNEFRYSHGYNLPKDDPKKYIKMWPRGAELVEDNVVLQDIVTCLLGDEGYELASIGVNQFQKIIYQNLEVHYPGNKNTEELKGSEDAAIRHIQV